MALAFVWFIVWGAIWGAIRGGKRAVIRMCTVIVALSLALLFTPLISRLFVSITIPGLGYSAGGFIESQFFSSGVGADIAEDAAGIVSFARGMAVVIINFIMFFVLFYLFKCLSWIVYFFLARRFAPIVRKSDIDANSDEVPTKRYRWAGVGIGIATGVIFFVFAMIPITGTMRAFDQVATHRTAFGAVTDETREYIREQDNFASTLLTAEEYIRSANRQIQNSFFGRFSKYTGMQWFGGFSMGYLSQVQAGGGGVNVRNDIVNAGRVTMDAVAIAAEFSRDGSLTDKVGDWAEQDFRALERTVYRIFNIGLVRMAFTFSGELVNIAQNHGVLDGMFNSISEEDGFAEAGYSALRIFTDRELMRDDLLNVIDVARSLFLRTNGANLYDDLSAVLDNFNEPDALQVAVDNFNARHTEQSVRRLTDAIFRFELVRAFLTDESLTLLYRIPLADALNVDRDNVVLRAAEDTNWYNVSRDSAALIIDLVNSMHSISELAGGEGEIEARIGDLSVDGIAGVLGTLTNTESIGQTMRAVIVSFIGDNDFALGEMAGMDMDEVVIGRIVTELESDKYIDWKTVLESLQSMAVFALTIGDGGDLDYNKLRGLLEGAADNPMMAEIVTELISTTVRDSANINISVDDDASQQFVYIMGGNSEALMNLFGGDDNDGLSTSNPDELLEIFGGAETIEKLVAVNEDDTVGNIQIDVSDLAVNKDDLMTAIENMANSPDNTLTREQILGLIVWQ